MHHIFLHIPKAGGSTLLDVIKRQYPKEKSFELITRGGKLKSTTAKFIGLPAQQKEKIQILMGHQPFGLHKHFEKDTLYFSIIRNPVSRVISTYEYAKEHPRHFLHNLIKNENLTLSEFLEKRPTFQVDNGMTRDFSGIADQEAVTAETLALAKKNIQQHFAAVGLIERYDESLLLFRERLHWPHLPVYFQKNKTQNKAKIEYDAETLARVKSINHFDIALFEFCKLKFEADLLTLSYPLEDQLNEFSAELSLFRKQNQWKDDLETTARGIYKRVFSIFK